jgi:isocitrate/isopropylmalate dehydrogenase
MRWLYQRTKVEAARVTGQIIERAVTGAIRGGTLTADLGGKASTDAFSKAVINELQTAELKTTEASSA